MSSGSISALLIMDTLRIDSSVPESEFSRLIGVRYDNPLELIPLVDLVVTTGFKLRSLGIDRPYCDNHHPKSNAQESLLALATVLSDNIPGRRRSGWWHGSR